MPQTIEPLSTPAAANVARRRTSLSAMPAWLLSSTLALLICVVWQVLVRALDVSAILVPAPTDIFRSLWEGFATGNLAAQAWVTLQEILVGYGIAVVAALVTAFVVTQSAVADKAVFPLVVVTQSIPKVAVAPLFIVWFGTGLGSKVVTIALISYFPLLVNAILGLRSTDPEQVAMMRSFGASRVQIFTRLQFPNALPAIFAGLDVAAVLAVTGAVVAEFVGATSGLGYEIQATNFSLDVSKTFAVLVVLSAIGLSLHATVVGVGRRVVFWSNSNSASGRDA